MYWIGPFLALLGLAALLYGFWKNSRKILAVAGITLFLAGSASEFVEGFKEGILVEEHSRSELG